MSRELRRIWRHIRNLLFRGGRRQSHRFQNINLPTRYNVQNLELQLRLIGFSRVAVDDAATQNRHDLERRLGGLKFRRFSGLSLSLLRRGEEPMSEVLGNGAQVVAHGSKVDGVGGPGGGAGIRGGVQVGRWRRGGHAACGRTRKIEIKLTACVELNGKG